MTSAKPRIHTIGFTQKSAPEFFDLLRAAGVKRVLDVRLNNSSQLAGFTKRDDLTFFLREIAAIEYRHVPSLAPSQDLFDWIKKKNGGWDAYERRFNALLRERAVENDLSPTELDLACLLCSEAEPERCHRRLVAEYLVASWKKGSIHHLC